MNTPLREAEQFWHRCALVAILAVAACTRFYALDQISLSSNELANLAVCNVEGWLAMVHQYHANNGGMPPLYPTLLCIVTGLTSDTEFFVRSLSALAGLGGIYFLYITGRDFISPTAGLLAAALMATELRTILVNRDATLYSLLALLLLIHNYCFCRLFFSTDCHTRRPLSLGYRSNAIDFHWSWHPDFPADACCLMGFWMSAALAFYTSPMSLVQILSEVLASAVLIRHSTLFPDWRVAMRSLWLPLLIVMLPWLPMFHKSSEWVLQGHLFAFQSFNIVQEQTRNLMPLDPRFRYTIAALLALFTLFVAARNIKALHWLNNNIFPSGNWIVFILLQLFIAAISLWLLLPASQLSYVYFWWVFILLLLAPIAVGIDLIPSNLIKNAIIGICVAIVFGMQISSNAYYKLYILGGNADFRLVANIIHDDSHFMSGNKNILMSGDVFKHYLDVTGVITTNTSTISTENAATNIAAAKDNSEFYYLEYSPYDRDMQQQSSAFQALVGQYKSVCSTKLPWLRVIKFSRDTSAADKTARDCRAYLSGVPTLQ